MNKLTQSIGYFVVVGLSVATALGGIMGTLDDPAVWFGRILIVTSGILIAGFTMANGIENLRRDR